MNAQTPDTPDWMDILHRLEMLRGGAERENVGQGGGRPESEFESELFSIYTPLLRDGPLVIAQLGQTLDGRIATRTGHSHFVTGPEDIVHLHRLRALMDAVVIGAGTALADNPRLTVREVSGRNPTRVLLDPSARVPLDRHLFQDTAAPTLWIVAPEASIGATPPGVEVLRLEQSADGVGFRPTDVLQTLRARGLNRVLVEGGGITVSRFLDAGALHRLHLTIAPFLLGSGRASLTLAPIDRLDQALRPRWRRFSLGADLLFDLEFSG